MFVEYLSFCLNFIEIDYEFSGLEINESFFVLNFVLKNIFSIFSQDFWWTEIIDSLIPSLFWKLFD